MYKFMNTTARDESMVGVSMVGVLGLAGAENKPPL